jgi:hypothetical protein
MSREKTEIAQRAAAYIADSAMSFSQARERAARDLGISGKTVMPDNHELEQALLEHLELFDEQGHLERINNLRSACLELMQSLAQFNPYVTGAAWKAVVSEHAHGHLQLFVDDPKMVQIALLNQGFDLEATTVPHFANRAEQIESLAINFKGWPFQICLYSSDDLRGALKPNAHGIVERGHRDQLLAKIAASMSNES